MAYAPQPSREPTAVSAYERGRYERDPAYRLKRINHTRALRGCPPVDSLDQVRLRRI